MQYGEQVFFQDSTTYVSRSRVVLAGATYPMQGISSVRVFQLERDWNLVTGAIGVILALITCGLWLPIGILLTYVQQRPYALLIGTSGAERQALVSANGNYIAAVHQAINQALMSR